LLQSIETSSLKESEAKPAAGQRGNTASDHLTSVEFSERMSLRREGRRLQSTPSPLKYVQSEEALPLRGSTQSSPIVPPSPLANNTKQALNAASSAPEPASTTSKPHRLPLRRAKNNFLIPAGSSEDD
jgi:hypothetical protein